MKPPTHEEQGATSGKKQNGECPDSETPSAPLSRLSTRVWAKVEGTLGDCASSSLIFWHGRQVNERLGFGSKERVVLRVRQKECVQADVALRHLVETLPGDLGSKFFNFGPGILMFLRLRPFCPLLLSLERDIDLIFAVRFVVSQQPG